MTSELSRFLGKNRKWFVRGKLSWFGGPNDSSDSGQTALGLSTSVPGVAIRRPGISPFDRATLGGYWVVRFPNRRYVVLRQTDLGPSSFTDRNIDVTNGALRKCGYTEANFPTDGIGKAWYIGMSKVRAERVERIVRRVGRK